jgi:MoxR-like ATPase
VSIDGKLYILEDPFFVIATQNPVESRGTYPLPEAQMDRFAMQFGLGYVSPEEEVEILTDQREKHPLEGLRPCVSKAEVSDLSNHLKGVHMSEELKRDIVDLVTATRSHRGVQLGASPRASLALMKTSKAVAMLEGSDFVTPEHIQAIAVPVIAHRLLLDPQAHFSGETAEGIVEDILKTVPVPA